MPGIITRTYCTIKAGICEVNGATIYSAPELPEGEFLQGLYKQLELNYPKFFKMDTLCKLGLLAAEPLLKNCEPSLLEETAVYLCNRASSLQTDRRHLENIRSREAYFPSPSQFVYTLPNIVIGEICIRHKIMGEGTFFLSENPNFDGVEKCAHLALNTGVAKQVLYGFVEADQGVAEAHLFLLKQTT